MNIKEKIYHFVAKRQPERQAQWPHWGDVKSVLVLYESDMTEKNTPMRAIRSELQKHGIDAVFWGYVPKKEVQSAVLPQSRIVGTQAFNLWGYPRKEVLGDLLERHYDLVIDLNQSNALPLRYLCLLADAAFRAGIADSKDTPHDLQIQTPPQENPTFLFEQILHYLTEIQSND